MDRTFLRALAPLFYSLYDPIIDAALVIREVDGDLVLMAIVVRESLEVVCRRIP